MAQAKPSTTTQRQWSIVTTGRTKLARNMLADAIVEIPDDELRSKLRQRMSMLFLFIEEDLQSTAADNWC
jgi:hypothetical protein